MTGLRAGVKRALGSGGYYRARLASRPYDGVAVLAYHGVRSDRLAPGSMRFEELHVTAARLDRHLAMLRELDCTPLSFRDWCAIASRERPLPPRAVFVTFDDGYRSVMTEALPVLERHQVPALVFVCTDPVERQIRFWFDAVAERSGEAAVEQAKRLDESSWRALAAAHVLPVTPTDPHTPLSPADVRCLAAHPLIAIGAHTMTHPILANLGPAVQRDEIVRSRTTLEAWSASPVTAFAYPNGRPGLDFTAGTARMVADAGFAHAFAIGRAFADPRTAAHAHPRFLMLDTVDASELAHRLAVAWR